MDVIERLKVLRSKNAGPFMITFDVVFKNQDDFALAKSKINADEIAKAFNRESADVESFDFFDELLAMKLSLRRRKPCGHPGDPDCYGMNQEQPLRRLLQKIFN